MSIESLELVRELYKTQDWVAHTTSGELHTFSKALPNGQTVTKGNLLVKDISKAAIISILSNPSVRPLFDSRIVSAEYIDQNLNGSATIYTVAKGQWPIVSDRDLVVQVSGWIHDDELGTVLIQKSVSDSRYPEGKNGRVRATLHICAFIVQETADGLRVVHFQNQDINGSIPSALGGILRTEQLSFLSKPVAYIRSKPTPPALVGNINVDQLEYTGSVSLDLKKGTYERVVKIVKEFEFQAYISPKLYPSGADISISGAEAKGAAKGDNVYSIVISPGESIKVTIIPAKTNKVSLNSVPIQ